MADFDPAKEAINLAKHRISLARWSISACWRSSTMIVSTTVNPVIGHTD
jgi:uncharacterized DUF497 family protein